jgi:hypothetical protein
MLDSKMACLCCDSTVLVDSTQWGRMEMPMALCPPCVDTVPLSVVKVLYILRSQVAALSNDMLLMKKDISRLFSAQQELEQAIVGED